MAKPAPVLRARHGARPAAQSTPVTAPQARHTTLPGRASYLAWLPAARSRSTSVTPLRLPAGKRGLARAVADSRDPGAMGADERLQHEPLEPEPREREPLDREPLDREPLEREPLERQSLERQIRFVLEADRLKTVARQSRITDGSRQENSAEHSWHLALMALALGEYAPAGTDLGRVMAMVVVHDLVEIDAGDLFLYSDSAAHARQEVAERAAADRIFALLPVPQAEAARALWDEFEERRTPEARFARALDRLEPMLLNMQTGGGTWVAHDVPLDQVLSKVQLIEEGSAALGGYARAMIAQAVERGFLRAVADPHAG
jgi:putative hydrolase of HD superfamily